MDGRNEGSPEERRLGRKEDGEGWKKGRMER